MLKHFYRNIGSTDVDHQVIQDEKKLDVREAEFITIEKAIISATQADIDNIISNDLEAPGLESSLSRLNSSKPVIGDSGITDEEAIITKHYQSQTMFLLVKALCKKCIKNGSQIPNFVLEQHIYQVIFHSAMIKWNDCNMNDENRRLFLDKLQKIAHVDEFPTRSDGRSKFVESLADYFQNRLKCTKRFKNRYDFQHHGELFSTCLAFTNFLHHKGSKLRIDAKLVSYWQK